MYEVGAKFFPLDGRRYERRGYNGVATVIDIIYSYDDEVYYVLKFNNEFSSGHTHEGRENSRCCMTIRDYRLDEYFFFIVDESNLPKYFINSYEYRPDSFQKYGNSTIGKYFGLEVEMDCGGHYDSKCSEILEVINAEDEIAYAVHDGSIDDGFEVVFQPMTMNYFRDNLNILNGLLKARQLGYRGDVETCGLHIHVDREAFGRNDIEREINIAKLVFLFEKHWGELICFSRRRDMGRLSRYAKRYLYNYNSSEGLQESILRNKRDLEIHDYDRRYFAINLQNTDTVEIRIFKGTLNYGSIMAMLQFVNRLVNVSSYSLERIRRMDFLSIIRPLMKKEEFEVYMNRIIDNRHFMMFPKVEELHT